MARVQRGCAGRHDAEGWFSVDIVCCLFVFCVYLACFLGGVQTALIPVMGIGLFTEHSQTAVTSDSKRDQIG